MNGTPFCPAVQAAVRTAADVTSPVTAPATDVAFVLAQADSLSQLDALVLVYQRDGDFVSLSEALGRRTDMVAELRVLLLGLMDRLEPGLGRYAEELAPCLLGRSLKTPEDRRRTLDSLLPFVESLEDTAAGFGTWAMAAGIAVTADGKHALASRYFERAARTEFPLAAQAAYLAVESCAASREADRMLALERKLEAGGAGPGSPGTAGAAPAHVLRAARVATGVALAGSRLAEDGRVMLEQLLREDLSGADAARVGLALGRYYLAKGDYGRAARSFMDAFQSGGAGPDVLAACGEYASLYGRGLAAGGLAESLSLADCLARSDREREAVGILETTLRANPRSTATLWELARLRYRMREYDEAARLFQKLESLERNRQESQRARLWLARCRRQTGRTDVSVRMMRELAERAGGAVGMEAAWEVGFDLESLGRLEEAASEYSSLNRKFPASGLGQESLWRRGFCEFRLGRYAEARAVFSLVRKNTTLADLRDASAFWALKCDVAAGKSVTRETVRTELSGPKPDSTGLYGAFLLALSRAERPANELFLRPWADVSSGRAVPRGPVASLHSDPTAVLRDLPQEFHNGAALLRLGLADLARVELSACERKLAGDRDGLVLLAQLYWRNGLYRKGVLTAERLLAADGANSGDGAAEPTKGFLRKITYPVCFAAPVYEQSRSQGVDPFLVLSVMKRESTFDPGAVSRAGAIGLMQLMPATARSVAAYLGEDTANLDLTDPEVNLRYGIWHLGRLIGRYSDSVVAALAAYNAGEDNAERWLRSARPAGAGETTGQPDGFVYMESVSFRETREYAHRVLADLQTYRTLY
jgi:soluble lytic murein transglycosylase